MNKSRDLIDEAEIVWKNPKAKKELLRMLKRFDDENSSLERKPIKGFKSLYELKNSGKGPRIIVQRGKPPKVIAFCMRKSLESTVAKLKNKYK